MKVHINDIEFNDVYMFTVCRPYITLNFTEFLKETPKEIHDKATKISTKYTYSDLPNNKILSIKIDTLDTLNIKSED